VAVCASMVAWTQAVELRWRPELGFFEKRSDILRQLELDGLLEAFQWEADAVTVRLGRFAALRLAVNGVSVYRGSPQGNNEQVQRALQRCLDLLTPTDVLFAGTRFQILEAIQGDPVELQGRTGALVAAELTPDACPTDWALLMDGTSERAESAFQVEFGVVSRNEAEFRIHSYGGQMKINANPALVQPDHEELPECAIYLHWYWPVSRRLEESPGLEAERVWCLLLEESAVLSERIRNRYVSQDMLGRKELG
jgi:hypothetical protein